MNSINGLLLQMSKRQDLLFALFFVLIVAMLVFPLPTWLIDALLAFNLVLSLIVLITATYLKHPLELSSFPSIILMTSIMRVALSVATTRLILATGDAGNLILAFGDFVISGNIVVGLVVFLIIAIVQFMVVTKGAERISEVSARFTLDALPGKQMSIDNDLRSGDITKEEARDKRQTLQLEIQFHGAMDGAMRFVKGDAIAGMIIVFINLIGGLTIGIAQRGLSFAEAGQLYVLLSVGDGLIAQIPAMFIALAAGTIVTRVTTDTASNLSKDVTRQLGAEPKALGVSGVVAVAMGFIPGFPTVVFLILGAALCAAAYLARGKGGVPTASKPAGEGAVAGEEGPAAEPEPEPLPLRPVERGDIMIINGNPATLELLRPDSAYAHVERVKVAFQRKMGFTAPPAGFRYDPSLEPGEFVIEIDDVPVQRFVVEGIEPPNPLTAEQAAEYAEQMGRVRERHASSLFGVPEAGQWLSEVQPSCGRLATDIQQVMPLMLMIDTIRKMLDDGLGLTPPRLILEGLIQSAQRSQDAEVVAELLRGFLRRQISHSVADAEKTINAVVLGPDADASIRDNGADRGAEAIRAADEAVQRLVANARATIEAQSTAGVRPVVMTTADTRRAMRALLRRNGVDVTVLSYSDVAPDYQVRTVAVLSTSALEPA